MSGGDDGQSAVTLAFAALVYLLRGLLVMGILRGLHDAQHAVPALGYGLSLAIAVVLS